MGDGSCFASKNAAQKRASESHLHTQLKPENLAVRAPSPEVLQMHAEAAAQLKPSDYTSWMERSPQVQRARAILAQAKCKQCEQEEKVQRAESGESASESSVAEIAASGFQGGATSLPHQATIEKSFGQDLSQVQAYVGGAAASACDALGAKAYASGNQIAFKSSPDVGLAAHEAAHVVQQASGKVQLSGGIGEVGDKYENHADRVASAVASGQSVQSLLQEYSAGGTQQGATQLKGDKSQSVKVSQLKSSNAPESQPEASEPQSESLALRREGLSLWDILMGLVALGKVTIEGANWLFNRLFGAQPANMGEDELVREIQKFERAIEAGEQRELDPPWRERENWPSDCQYVGEFDNGDGSKTCLYRCRHDPTRSLVYAFTESGNECPMWRDWFPPDRWIR